MRRVGVASMIVVLVLTACGEEDSGSTGGADSDTAGGVETADGGGSVVDQQPAGQALVSVEGRDYTLEVSPAVDCSIADDSISYSFWVGDNSVVLGGGANLYEDGWVGSINLRVAEPEGEDGPISFFPDLAENGDRISTSGNSMSYSGPIQKQPPNDGSNPDPVDVGNGVISVTCP